MIRSNLTGSENRLCYRLIEDVNNTTRYTSRVADANADRQTMQRAQTMLSNGAPLTTTSGQQSIQNLQSLASGEQYNAVQSGTRTGPSSADIMDQATLSAQGLRTNFNQTTGNIQSDNTALRTNSSQPTPGGLQFGQQASAAIGTFNSPALPGSEPTPTGQESKSGEPDAFYGQWGNPSDMAANAALQNENLRGDMLRQQMQKDQATDSANSSALNSAASQNNASPESQTDLGKFEPMLAGLPPEEADSIRAWLQSAFDSSDTQKGDAKANYADEIKTADQSFNAYDKVLSQQRSDSTNLYNATQGFLDDVQERREEATAKAKENAIEQLKWEENRAVRQQKSANDKLVNKLVLGQAIGGGFGSSNWTAEVSEAEWEGEQAIIDLQKEFGFKRVDVDIAFTEQMNGIYEFYGSQKIDALKTYKTELQNNSNLRFSAVEKTEERKSTARQNLNNTLALIAKEETAEIKEATKEVRTTLKELRTEKRNEEHSKKTNAYNFFTWAMSNSNDPVLRGAAAKMMREAGYNLPQNIDLNALSIDDQLALMEAGSDAETSQLYNPAQFTDKESQMLYSQAINAVTGIPGATDAIRESNLQQVKDLLDAGDLKGAKDKVRSVASLKLKGEIPEFSARAAIASEAEQVITLLESNPNIRNMYTGKWQDAMRYLATNQNPDYLAVTAWLGNLTAETIKERYGSAISEGERTEMQRSIPSGKETVQDAIVKLKALVRSNTVKNDALIDTHLGGVSYSSPPVNQPQTYGSDWVIQQMRGQPAPANGGGGGPVTIPKENGSIQTGFVNGIVTGYGSKYWKAGVDIAAPKGAPITTPIGGIVEDVVYNPAWVGTPNNAKVGKSQNGGWGNTVKVRYPDGVKLQFAHLSKSAIGKDMVGKPVEPGATLAYVGNTGNTYGKTGVHVDVTGYRPDGSTMTAEEVTEWMLRNSSTQS